MQTTVLMNGFGANGFVYSDSLCSSILRLRRSRCSLAFRAMYPGWASRLHRNLPAVLREHIDEAAAAVAAAAVVVALALAPALALVVALALALALAPS